MKAHELVPLILKAFPMSQSPPAPGMLKSTIYRIAYDRFDGDQDKAAEWLYSRVQAWAKSSLCRSTDPKYRAGMARWMSEEQYDSPDECWMTKEERNETARKARAAEQREARDQAEKIGPSPELPRRLRFGGGAA